jgi:hypothetical protein
MAAQLLAILVPWAGIDDLSPALAALTALNMAIIRRHPRMPDIYFGGVRYEREKRLADGTTREQWLTCPVILQRGVADCEDLGAWLSAIRQLQGIDAHAVPIHTSIGYHIVVRYPDGTIEDPSRKLGM